MNRFREDVMNMVISAIQSGVQNEINSASSRLHDIINNIRHHIELHEGVVEVDAGSLSSIDILDWGTCPERAIGYVARSMGRYEKLRMTHNHLSTLMVDLREGEMVAAIGKFSGLVVEVPNDG